MTQLHLEVDGPDDAPVVVLANSLGTDLHLWDAQARVLSRSFRVVRYDMRGHGRSRWTGGQLTIEDLGRDLMSVLDAVGVPRASVCGVSIGGMAAMAAARLAPERIDRLVLCCTSAHLPPAQAWLDRAALVRSDGMSAVVDAVLARWFTPAFSQSHPDLVEQVRAMLLATDADAYAACCEAIAAMDQRDAIASITAPTLVISAADDPATPPDHGTVIAHAIAGARHLVVDRAAHLANVEQADVVTGAILAHLAPEAVAPAAAARIAGERIRREVLGDAHVDAAAARATPLTGAFQEWVTGSAWGAVWARDGLDRRTRSAITVAMLVALGRHEELALHLRGAIANGLTREEIAEVLLQTAVYCGAPAANSAFAVAARVLVDG